MQSRAMACIRNTGATDRVQRGKAIMPKNAVAYPWRLNQEYVADRKRMKEDPVDDGLLDFRRHGANARGAGEQLEAAE